MSAGTIDALFEAMPERLDVRAARGLDAVIQFEITGPDAGVYVVSVRNGAASVAKGAHRAPNVKLKMSADTYLDLVMGRISGPQALFKRRLRVKGDINCAMRLHALFPPVNDKAEIDAYLRNRA
ncbi:MAG: SCP2 sterol-binding domain-containing protein [Pseudomonadota bacterium]